MNAFTVYNVEGHVSFSLKQTEIHLERFWPSGTSDMKGEVIIFCINKAGLTLEVKSRIV